MVLLDIKHTDAAVHKQVTGVDNELILKNLDYICRQKIKFRVRVPLIPGINDSREVIENICRLVCGSEALDRIELLPYNKAAGAKYPMVGKIYNPGFDTERDPKTYLNIIKKYNLRCVVL